MITAGKVWLQTDKAGTSNKLRLTIKTSKHKTQRQWQEKYGDGEKFTKWEIKDTV